MPITFQHPRTGLVERAQAHASRHYKAKGDALAVYYNYQRVAGIVSLLPAMAEDAADWYGLELAEVAAWLHDLSAEPLASASAWLEAEGANAGDSRRVLQAIKGWQEQAGALSPEAMWLSDAIHAYDYAEDYEQRHALRRLEAELRQGQPPFERLRWEQLEWQRLRQVCYHSEKGRTTYASLTAAAILAQHKRLENQAKKKSSSSAPVNLRPFQGLDEDQPERAAQTFFRTNYRNHINLSSIADSKANIMISVNSILISVVISILSYGNIADQRPAILMPVVVFLVTGLSSLIFAVLSARPRITAPQAEPWRNVTFFGAFAHMSVEDYEAAMDKVLRDGELLYGNMVRDLYFLGKVLERKYRLLNISYGIFLVGFSGTVLSFLLAFLLS